MTPSDDERELAKVWQGILESSPDAIVLVCKNGTVESANAVAQEQLGMAGGALVGTNLYDALPNEIRAERRQRIELSLSAGEASRWEERWGGHFFLHTAFPVRGRQAAVLISRDVTQQRLAEESAQNKRARLKTLIETLPDLIWLKDTEGRYVNCNHKFERFFGAVEADIKGKTDYDFLPREQAESFRRDAEAAMRSGEPIVARQWVTYAQDGRREFVEIINSPFVDSLGALKGVMGIARDVTAFKKAEEDLRYQSSLYRTQLDLALDAILVVDRAGRIINYNRQFAGTWGIADEVLRQGVEAQSIELLIERVEDRERFLECIRYLHQHPEERAVHGEIRLKNGNRLEHYSAPIIDEGNAYLGRIWYFRDITERKHAEEKLRATHDALARRTLELQSSESMLHEAQRIAALGHYVYDFPSETWTSSEGLDRVFGIGKSYPRSGASWLGLIHPEDRERVDVYFRGHVRSGRKGFDCEYRIKRQTDGEVRWVHGQGDLRSDSSGAPIAIFGIIQDVTERRRADDALREVDRRKDEFLAMLSHELRNPLAPIRSSLFVLGRAAPGGEQARRALAVVDRQVQHLTRIVDELLDVNRITRGRIELKRERFRLDELVRLTVEDYRGAFTAGGVELKLEPAQGEVWVDGDRTRLAQAIGNLLHNTAKFTPRGGRAAVSVEADLPRAQAVVSVHDTGAGIAPEMLPRLFQPFTQADRTLERSKGGLGLGLALVKGLVEMHGGAVSAASEGVGRGAVFTLRLPLHGTGALSASTQRLPQSAPSPRRVLIIEDNVDAAESLRDALELGGHVVTVANDGPSGIESAQALKPGVVLCDIGLPGMDGYAVARALRATPELDRITLVALTGYAQAEDVAKALEAGFDAHLAKPPSMAELERMLAEAA